MAVEPTGGSSPFRLDSGDLDPSRLVVVLCPKDGAGQAPVVSLRKAGASAQTHTNGLAVDRVGDATAAVSAYFPPVPAGRYVVTVDDERAGEVTVPAAESVDGADCPSARPTDADVSTVGCGELLVLRWTIESPVAADEVQLIDIGVLDGRSSSELGFYRIDVSDGAPGKLVVTFGTKLPSAHGVTLVARELYDTAGRSHALDGRVFVPLA